MAVGFLPIGTQAALVEDASPYLTQQMLLGDDLTFRLQGNINYYFAEHAIATLTYGDQVETYRLEDLTPVGDGQYAIEAELAAAQMTEDIVLTIRVGEVEVLQETYSIRNYLSALLDGNYSNQTKQLCRELLNYGAWAQKYFEYCQDDLANSGYEIEPQYAIAEEMPGVEFSGSVSGVNFYGTSMRFTSKTAVRYYFTGNAANCTFTVDGVPYTPVSKDGMYYIEVPGVNPQDMETPMQVKVTDGADTLSVCYVPLNFFVRSYQKATDETYRGLLQAAYSYFKTAASYTPEGNEDLGQSGGTEETPEVVPDSDNLILGFESYEELTGTKLSVGNMLGRMEVNTDRDYITQGKASLKVSPQGDYNRQDAHPYFKLDLLNTTCKVSDFSDIKQISFDVYNEENQTLHISVGLVTGEDPEAYLTTNKQTFTLAPNGWTTCTYDLSIMAGYNFYDLSHVRYMTFSFPEHKKTREDVPNTLYIDNLCADPYGQGEGPVQPGFDFAAGVGFETDGQDYLVTGQGIKDRDADIERIVYYSSGTVAAPAGGGIYGLRLSHESNYWPTFRLHFGQTLPAGTELSFMAYGRIYGKNLYNKSVFEFSSGGDATEEFDCGQWTQLYLTLPAEAEYIDLFWNIDRANITSGSASGQVYIDNIQFVRSEPAGDILEGYGFEERGNAERFTGQGDTANDATIKRFTYKSLGIDAPTDGGEYALKLTHSSSQEPTFRINFGKKLAAGTEITFMAYSRLIDGYVLPKKNVIKYGNGTNATASFEFKVWNTLTVTLQEEAEYIDLIWSFKGTFGSAVCELYIDNIKAVEPEIVFTGDLTQGIDFETVGQEQLFAGIGENQAVTIERVSYADAKVTAPANGGSYALKVSHTSNCWPNFRVNFGKTLKAGTTITFDVYGNYDYAAAAGVTKYMKLELTADSKNFAQSAESNQVLWTVVETWRTGVTITLTADSDHVDFFYNVADGQHGEVPSWILMDNFKAVEPTDSTDPEEAVGDFTEGVDFETVGQEQLFAGVGADQAATIERVSYADANVTAPENGGSYALKVSHTSNCWPNFRVNFGKTLKAGTTITFDVYGNYDYVAAAGVTKYMKLELTADSKKFAASADSNQVLWTVVETWRTGVTITLTADSDHVDFFYNVADGQHGEVPSWLLLDNFLAVEPEESFGDFTEGVDFETVDQEQMFAGIGENQAATIERVSYADANVTAPENGGSYALKVSHASNCWPNFRVNFGKTLKAGTTITFDVYGNYDYAAAAGVTKYMKLELTADSKKFAASADSNQVLWTVVETWRTGVTITLTADSDHVDFFYNVADGQHGEVPSWILLDNFKAVEPLLITEGFGFEDSGDVEAFIGIADHQAATIERVSYADANVSAPANGGSYALKVSHASNCWPNFRVNFGKTLKAGTTITFDVYGNYDYAAAEGVTKYMKLELTADSKKFAASADSNQVLWTVVETWRTGVTITLTADSDHVDFFYNVADGQHGEVPSWLLLDNFKATD